MYLYSAEVFVSKAGSNFFSNFCIRSVAWIRSSCSEVSLGKGALKISSKFTGEHPYRSVISIKLLPNLLHIFRTPFPKNTSGWLLLINSWNKSSAIKNSERVFDKVNIRILFSWKLHFSHLMRYYKVNIRSLFSWKLQFVETLCHSAAWHWKLLGSSEEFLVSNKKIKNICMLPLFQKFEPYDNLKDKI